MNKRSQLVCLWCGPVFIAIFTLSFLVFARFVPPPSPSKSAEQIAELFRDHTLRLRLGFAIPMMASGLYIPWCCAMAVQMRRIEGRWSPLMYAQLTSGAMAAILFGFPLLILEAATYRPERNPEITQFAVDLGLIALVGAVFLALVQNMSLGLAILQDRRPRPVYPRWSGWFNVWVAVVFMSGGLDVFFKSGPFAWNGVFAWWIPLSVLGLWVGVMTWLTIVAINDHEREVAGADG